MLFALSLVDFGFDDAGTSGRYGHNLDKRCTCPGPASCVRKLPDGGAGNVVCDRPNGVDNNGKVFLNAAKAMFVTQPQLNQALMNGASGALVRVSK